MLYSFLQKILPFFLKLFFKLEVENKPNDLEERPLIICANHKHFLDPLIISLLIKPQIIWIAKEELMKNPISSFFIKKLNALPVKRDGMDMKLLRQALKALEEDKIIGIFPEGTRLENEDLEAAKPGVALLAAKSDAKLLPIKIVSNYKLFNKIKVVFGESFRLELPNARLKTKDYQELSKEILEKIYILD